MFEMVKERMLMVRHVEEDQLELREVDGGMLFTRTIFFFC
jgi:hypothetical protein